MIIDTAVIAAGGEGKRMKESGIMIPKPLVSFQGKPLISYFLYPDTEYIYGIKMYFQRKR